MKYYRVEPAIHGKYVVQHRKWFIWRTLLEYINRSDALMHLSSLNEGNLRAAEKQVARFDAWLSKIETWFNKLRS